MKLPTEEKMNETIEIFRPLVEGFMKNRHRFETLGAIRKATTQHIEKIRRSGGHRKTFGKKMLSKLNDQIHTEHIKNKRTFVIRRLRAEKRKFWVDYVFINYFSGPGGIIYALRGGSSESDLFFFTAHFFDRLAERGYGVDPLDRFGVVKTFLLDFAVAQTGVGFTAHNIEKLTAKTFLGHGIGVGEYLPINYVPSLDIEGRDPKTVAKNQVLYAVKMTTYLAPEMIHPDLLRVFNKGSKYLSEHADELSSVLKHV